MVYLRGDADRTVRFFQTLTAELEAHFAQYELVAVDDAADPTVVKALRSWAADLPKPLTILHMSLHQGLEPAMNAGLDAAIGDYVYEFDSTEMPYDASLIFEAYRTAQQGSDIVSVCPKQTRGGSGLFTRCSTPTPTALPPAHRRFPPGHPAGHQPGARFQRPPALPQGGLCGFRPEDDRPGI